ncbi:uncharacterized protein TNCV_4138781 [Trichonephila clavipes]|nr:uncharacterized protein TNCV_4138781 [Trichonephila clavipes]
MIDLILTSHCSATRGLLATDHVILNHGQVTWTTPELAPPLLTTTPHQREDVSALDRFNVHRCPTRRGFCGTGIELVTRQATIRYLYHSATAALGVKLAIVFFLSLVAVTPPSRSLFHAVEVLTSTPLSNKSSQRTATAGSDVVQSGRPIFDDFFQHLGPYIGNNTANVVFQMVKRLWLICIDQ